MFFTNDYSGHNVISCTSLSDLNKKLFFLQAAFHRQNYFVLFTFNNVFGSLEKE